MLKFFKKVFGSNTEELRNAIQNGGSIIDVRTPGEYKTGHVRGSVNIPLDQISGKFGKIEKMSQPIVTCCASGMRSGTAASVLRNKGIQSVYNGGPWTKVQSLSVK